MKLFNFFKKNRDMRSEAVKFGDELSFLAHETYRLLRTNVTFCLSGDNKSHVIGITSSVKGEAKSTSSINLSYTLAEDNKKVCLVEADMRIPTLKHNLNLETKKGLSELLTGQATVEEVSVLAQFEKVNFTCITAGTLPPNPAELLSSPKMEQLLKELSEQFDYVIVDLPPVNMVSDACIVGSKLDGMIVCVAQGYCTKKALSASMRQLALSRIKVLGFVRTYTKSAEFGYNKGYKKYYKREN